MIFIWPFHSGLAGILDNDYFHSYAAGACALLSSHNEVPVFEQDAAAV
jgi:hypothetical protein